MVAITYTSGELVINRHIPISHPGAGVLAIRGNQDRRGLRITADQGAVIISGLTVRDGRREGAGSTNDHSIT